MDNNIIDKRTTGELKISNVLSDKNRIAILSTGKDQRLIAEVVRGENGIGEAKAAFIVKACNEYPKLKLAAKLLEELTPGGSEYFDDPEYCFKTVKGLIASIPSQILGKYILIDTGLF